MGFGTFTIVKLFGIIVLQFMGHPPGGYRILFYHNCTPPTTSMKLLLCLWTWGIFFFFFFFFGGFQHLLSMIVQQLVAILELSQEEMIAHLSTQPS